MVVASDFQPITNHDTPSPPNILLLLFISSWHRIRKKKNNKKHDNIFQLQWITL